MPERLTLTDDDLRHYMSLDGFTLERIAKLYHVPLPQVEKQWARIERGRQEENQRQIQLLQRATSGRPFPPDALCIPNSQHDFVPAPDLADWVKKTFIYREASLCNTAHLHLRAARLGFLWTNVPNRRQTKPVAGMATIPKAQGNKWDKARHDYLMEHWFRRVPHFLITLDARYAAQASDAGFCSLIEHELLHCAQAKDMFGEPRFNLDDEPVFIIRGHDAEEFVGVVERYGVGNAAGGVAELVAAAAQRPSIAAAEIRAACGTCLK